MRTIIKSVTIFASLVFLATIGCKKDINNNITVNNTETTFNVGDAKTWFSNTFATTSLYKSGELADKKIVDWSKPVFYQNGPEEAIEFPLLKSKSAFPIPNNNLSEQQKQKIANASLSKVQFVRSKDGNITIKEINFIPDWDYLTDQKFDISKATLNSKKNDFTGKIIVKDWEENNMIIKMYENGKSIKIVTLGKKQVQPNSNNLEGECEGSYPPECSCQRWCQYVQHCEIYGDGMEICGNWEENYCWDEVHCDDPGGGGGNEDPGTTANVQRDFTIKRQLTAYENWELKGTVDLSGMVFNNPQLNYFSSINNNNSVQVLWCYQANCAWNQHSLYITPGVTTSTTNLLTPPTQAVANFQTSVIYPNWPGGANTVYYSGTHTWYAETDLQ